ncbi:DUF4230 domain-containing protein [Leptolyngbya sp. PCC 6406]|uniref:DUF4230 domain-containing protein n=1 Tax=Leptolyngbya sp. PCC 6406 TaxID=1173264 RepID=UPI00047F1766|nr:DUF4230 domain-containing protein [Leptolyngbya sp. PCC 6406]
MAKTIGNLTDHVTGQMVKLGAIAIGLLLALAFLLQALPSPFSITTITEVQDLLLGQIQAESLLTTASQDISANVTIDQVAKVLKIPIGTTNLVYAAVGKASAGIDLHSIEVVKFNREARSVTLRIPAAEMNISLNPERSETLANYRNWFGPKAGIEIYQDAQRQAAAAMSSKACTSGILNAATHNAEVEIRAILTKVGFQQVTFKTTPTACPTA